MRESIASAHTTVAIGSDQMSIRESIQQSPRITAAAAVLVIIGTAVWIYSSSSSDLTQRLLTTRAFYTVDEGKTWFLDDAEKIPPFQHEGRTAYRVQVYSSSGGKNQFAGYLMRYTTDAAKRLEAAKRGDAAAARIQPGRPMLSLVDELAISGTEIKKPGAGNAWVRRSDIQAAQPILDVRGPDGQPADPVLP